MPASIAPLTEYLFRYNTQGTMYEPMPIYSQLTLDGKLRVLWTDSSAAILTQKIHVSTFVEGVLESDWTVPGTSGRGMAVHPTGMRPAKGLCTWVRAR